MNEKLKKVFSCISIIVICAVFICSIGFSVYYRIQYTRIQSTLDATNYGELQQKLESVTDSLERVSAALIKSEQSVERLEEVDQRRAGGIRRIFGIIDSAGESVIGIASGEQRARIAFEAIARIVDELEAEFGGSAE